MKPTKSPFITERHDVLGDIAEVVRTKASGDIYQFRMWVSREAKYYRSSLKTDDLHIALERGQKKALSVLGVIESGKKVFGITVGDLVVAYLLEKKKDVDNEYITSGRLVAIRAYLNNFISFIGKNTATGSLNSQSCFDYAEWRKKHKGGAADVTIKNEKAAINSMMKYAFKKRYTDFDSFEFRKVGRGQKEISRRGVFEDHEYEEIISFLRTWTAKNNNSDTYIRFKRMMIRDMFFIASNTLLRIGELMNLLWEDVLGYEEYKDSIGHRVTLVTIRVRKETSKVRRERIITVRGGEYFRRWHGHTNQKKSDDFILIRPNGRLKQLREEIYEFWREIMEGVGLDYKGRKLTWYSCRHYGITCRLKAGVKVYDIAQMAGTSVSQIESHYGHFDQSMSRAASLLNYRDTRERIVFEGDLLSRSSNER
jgi:integrase